MTDDQNMALNEAAGAEPSIDSTPEPETKTTEEVLETPVETESTEEVKTEEEKTETEESSKKGANQRIRELNEKAKAAEARAQSLADRLAEITGSVELAGFNQPYVSQVQPGAEISPEQYEQDVTRKADSLVTLRLKQQEVTNRINNEANDSIRKYPQLDPESNSFDKELSDSITEATEGYVNKNPYGAKVSQFVDKLMKPYQRAVDKEVGKVTENIAKQVSQTALRPTSVRQVEKKTEDMTVAELEAELGIVSS